MTKVDDALPSSPTTSGLSWISPLSSPLTNCEGTSDESERGSDGGVVMSVRSAVAVDAGERVKARRFRASPRNQQVCFSSADEGGRRSDVEGSDDGGHVGGQHAMPEAAFLPTPAVKDARTRVTKNRKRRRGKDGPRAVDKKDNQEEGREADEDNNDTNGGDDEDGNGYEDGTGLCGSAQRRRSRQRGRTRRKSHTAKEEDAEVLVEGVVGKRAMKKVKAEGNGKGNAGKRKIKQLETPPHLTPSRRTLRGRAPAGTQIGFVDALFDLDDRYQGSLPPTLPPMDLAVRTLLFGSFLAYLPIHHVHPPSSDDGMLAFLKPVTRPPREILCLGLPPKWVFSRWARFLQAVG